MAFDLSTLIKTTLYVIYIAQRRNNRALCAPFWPKLLTIRNILGARLVFYRAPIVPLSCPQRAPNGRCLFMLKGMPVYGRSDRGLL